MAPDDLIDHVVGFIDLVGNAVVVDVKRRIVTPVVALPSLGPLDIARAHILHLGAVIDECVGIDIILLGAGGEMNADQALLKQLVTELIKVGVVNENAFFRIYDSISRLFRIVRCI